MAHGVHCLGSIAADDLLEHHVLLLHLHMHALLALEPPLVELPPHQLPRAGITRRLTVPWGYDPLPRTPEQL